MINGLFDGVVGSLERLLELLKLHGWFKLITMTIFLALTIFIFGFITYKLINFDQSVKDILEEREQMETLIHDEAMVNRREIQDDISNVLSSSIRDLKGDCVFIIEMHNGIHNPGGLPFVYGEMTYSDFKDGFISLEDDFIKLNLTRYNIFNHVVKNQIWFGTVNDLKTIDKKFATRLEHNDVEYIAMLTLHGTKNVLGYYGVVYRNKEYVPKVEEIRANLNKSAQKLSILLDINKEEVEF